MTVIHVGHYHDEGRVSHHLPVTLARSSKKQGAANHNTITLAENFSTTSQEHLGWKVTRLTALHHLHASMRSALLGDKRSASVSSQDGQRFRSQLSERRNPSFISVVVINTLT